MPPTLYHVPRTISSPLVQILLELGVVDKPVVVHELNFADLKSPEHLAINPMGTSPAFRDDGIDVVMWESGAILDYLLERYDPAHKFGPHIVHASSGDEHLRKRAKYLHLKQYILATVYPFIASLYVHTLRPVPDQDGEYLEAAKKKCHTVLGPVLTEWLGDGPYFLGTEISAVDFLVAKPLSNIRAMGWLGEFPALKGLYERVSSRPSFDFAYEGMQQKQKQKSPPNDRTIVLVPSKKRTRGCTV